MAIEGDLRELKVASLLQLAGLEQRKVTITLRHAGEEGVLVLDGERVLHASLGDQVGTDVAYDLVGWEEGIFRVTETLETPEETVGLSFTHLLLESARRTDEFRRVSSTDLLGRGDAASDERWEDRLFVLLAELEAVAEKLQDRKCQRRPVLALEILVDMTNHLLDSCRSLPGGDRKGFDARRLLAVASAKYPQVSIVQATPQALSAKSARSLYKSWADSDAARVDTFRRMCLGVVDVIERCLERLGSQFTIETRTKEWVNTYRVFVLELGRAVDTLHF